MRVLNGRVGDILVATASLLALFLNRKPTLSNYMERITAIVTGSSEQNLGEWGTPFAWEERLFDFADGLRSLSQEWRLPGSD